jgi:hypothetical protein
MPDYTPTWLDVADVKAQLRLAAADTADDDLVTRCAAAVEPQVQRARPDGYPTATPADVRGVIVGDRLAALPYTPDAETYQAAVMLAARLVRRRNSPGGVETFGESVTFVSRYDPEIARALRTGLWALPGVG